MITIGVRAWTVFGQDYDIYVSEGEVIAIGPDVVVLATDGPWVNEPRMNRIVNRKRLVMGRAPRMLDGGESFLDHACRCEVLLTASKPV